VSGLKEHVNKVQMIMRILKPTKIKLAILAALMGGGYAGSEPLGKVVQWLLDIFK
jgi:hypothetical protein